MSGNFSGMGFFYAFYFLINRNIFIFVLTGCWQLRKNGMFYFQLYRNSFSALLIERITSIFKMYTLEERKYSFWNDL